MEQQYLQLIRDILEKGTLKAAARENMPGTPSLFGYQMRHNLQEGFPLLTTKPVWFRGLVVELLWFLRGDTNIKFLDDHKVRSLWHEDAYNYYTKKCKEQNILNPFSFELFCSIIKNAKNLKELKIDSDKNSSFSEHSRNTIPKNYVLGDCGKQYGYLWRNWGTGKEETYDTGETYTGSEGREKVWGIREKSVDQVKELIEGLKKNPMGRRHIITAWNPTTLNDMALNACHAFVQWNCRPLSIEERWELYHKSEMEPLSPQTSIEDSELHRVCNDCNIPKYYLDCQLYQRSADTILGVPLNIASYSLMTELLARICNMIPGDFVHTFGDVHIYENHIEAAKEQLERVPKTLPKLEVFKKHPDHQTLPDHFEKYLTNRYTLDDFIDSLTFADFTLENYDPYPKLVNDTTLSTGLKK